jgi:hypothetical protein
MEMGRGGCGGERERKCEKVAGEEDVKGNGKK